MNFWPLINKKIGKQDPQFNYSSGQALLIVLLTMTVVLTVVLSVVSRSITDITITTYGEESQRAFDAAEAGIEQVLIQQPIVGFTDPVPLPGSEDTFQVEVSAATPDNNEFDYPDDLLSGETATFWFVSHNDDGELKCGPCSTCAGGSWPCLRANRLNICWGNLGTNPNDSEAPAVELSLYYDLTQSVITTGNYSSVRVARFALDPQLSRVDDNKFDYTNNSCPMVGGNYAFSTGNIDVTSIPCWNTAGCFLMLKARMFYNTSPSNAHPIGLRANATGGSNLPAQGLQIDSKGVAGESTRKVNIFQTYSEPPTVFDSSIFTINDLTK